MWLAFPYKLSWSSTCFIYFYFIFIYTRARLSVLRRILLLRKPCLDHHASRPHEAKTEPFKLHVKGRGYRSIQAPHSEASGAWEEIELLLEKFLPFGSGNRSMQLHISCSHTNTNAVLGKAIRLYVYVLSWCDVFSSR